MISSSAGAKLKAKRFSTAASVLDGCIYVTGGYDGSYLQARGEGRGGGLYGSRQDLGGLRSSWPEACLLASAGPASAIECCVCCFLLPVLAVPMI